VIREERVEAPTRAETGEMLDTRDGLTSEEGRIVSYFGRCVKDYTQWTRWMCLFGCTGGCRHTAAVVAFQPAV
jgi:hypothetical protein